MKPICVPCQRFYRPKKNGYFFLEMMPITSDALPGTAQPEGWQPYKLWVGDLWRCEGCGHETIAGVNHRRITEHYMDRFKEEVARLGADRFKVNDC